MGYSAQLPDLLKYWLSMCCIHCAYKPRLSEQAALRVHRQPTALITVSYSAPSYRQVEHYRLQTVCCLALVVPVHLAVGLLHSL